MTRCIFLRLYLDGPSGQIWRDYCGKPGDPYCVIHKGQICTKCDKYQAFGECDRMGEQLPCGHKFCLSCMECKKGHVQIL